MKIARISQNLFPVIFLCSYICILHIIETFTEHFLYAGLISVIDVFKGAGCCSLIYILGMMIYFRLICIKSSLCT